MARYTDFQTQYEQDRFANDESWVDALIGRHGLSVAREAFILERTRHGMSAELANADFDSVLPSIQEQRRFMGRPLIEDIHASL